MTIGDPAIDVRRAEERFITKLDWLESKHSFSFSTHYDPANTNHGLLIVSNDDIVQPGTGFQTHPHRDMEIVTWVLEGELEHKDSEGYSGIIYPGLAQRMSAGTGIWHSEMNATPGGAVHFVQMWVLPDAARISPSYQQLEIVTELGEGGLVPVASGRGHDAAISIRQRGAVLWAGQLDGGESVRLPDAAYVHLYVARGGGTLEGAGALSQGDAVRLTGGGGHTLTADADHGAEVLVWQMDSGPSARQ
jgi:redox-sensitive bicupin YhaK (pirin superfamily)